MKLEQGKKTVVIACYMIALIPPLTLKIRKFGIKFIQTSMPFGYTLDYS